MKLHLFCLGLLLAAGCHSSLKGVDVGPFDMGVDNPDLPGGPDTDMAGADLVGTVCAPASTMCSGGMLQTCNGAGSEYTTTACALGCGGSPAHCLQLQPTAPVMASDLDDGDLTAPAAVALPRLVFDLATGKITDGGTGVYRDPNSGAGAREVHQGIAFRRATGVSIWTFKGLTIPAGTTIVFDNSVANSAAALLSSADLTVAGTIDARGYGDPKNATTLCLSTLGGPGGGAGGDGTTAANGGGGGPASAGGTALVAAAGGGGGGNGDTGGNGGGDPGNKNSGMGGMASMTPNTLAPLRGGAGGGGAPTAGAGGGGGGGVQLVAVGTLTISGTLNAGGCGGQAGAGVGLGGGGGGSGGALLLEAPSISVTASGVIAANGGGGGGGGNVASQPGQPGQPNGGVAQGGGGGGFLGGNGGAANGTTNGTNGAKGNGGGAGGGGIGRIRINTASGTPTIDSNAVLSPTIASTLASVGVAPIN